MSTQHFLAFLNPANRLYFLRIQRTSQALMRLRSECSSVR